jgi:predicted dehydrogenase
MCDRELRLTPVMSTETPLAKSARRDLSDIRLAYVGCGFMAQNVHLPNFSSLAGCKLVALAEKRKLLRQTIAAKYGIARAYERHSDLTSDSEIDAVAVSADYTGQGEIAADLLRAGKHVFMEKPMAVSLQQAERILQAAKFSGARLMIGYMKRFDPGIVFIQEVARNWRRENTAGAILLVRNHGFGGDWLSGLEPLMIHTGEPIESPALGHLPEWLPPTFQKSYIDYLQQYTHNINLLRFVLDVQHVDEIEVESVNLDPDGFTGIVVLRMAGVRCVVESARSDFHGWDEHTQVYFERGWLKVVSQPLLSRSAYSQVEIYQRGSVPEYRYPTPAPIPTWCYREEVKHFIESLQNQTPFRSSGEDTLADVWIMEQIYKAFIPV